MITESHSDALGLKSLTFIIKNYRSQTIISKGIVETKDTSGVLKG